MDSLDILYLTLSVCAALLTIFISITLIYLLFILRDITKVADSVKSTVDKINNYIARPILLTKSIIEFVTPFIRTAEDKFSRRGKAR